MPKLEIKRKLTLSRQEAADRLVALGRALADDSSEVELSSGGDKLKLSVGSTVEWELEIEIDGNETELEIELKWRDDTDAEQAEQAEDASAASPTARRGRPRKSST
jgi:amphi-Trp domain-containing protein